MSTAPFKKVAFLSIVAFMLVGGHAFAAIVTNKDITSLLEAGMGEDVVLQAIASGEPKFDTSSGALIKLKQKGATPAILKAMMSSKDKPVQTQAANAVPSKKAIASGLNPEEIVLAIDGKETQMQYIIPSIRTAARALGFGGVASYAVLRGERAQLRLSPSMPEFIVSVPKNAQASNYFTLANFAVRKNQTREVLIGGGYMSYTTGIHRDRVVAVTSEVAEDQSRAKEGFILHRVRPEKNMVSGEYAIVLYTGEIRTLGFFAQASNSYFDFGVD